jgi:hypothetical protein
MDLSEEKPWNIVSQLQHALRNPEVMPAKSIPPAKRLKLNAFVSDTAQDIVNH